MKSQILPLFFLGFFLSLNTASYCQTEIKGSGTTSATNTLVTKNATPTTTLVVRDDGNVGIGLTNPSSKLHVNGVITSGAGGFTFPDGTTQTTAAITGVSYHNVFTVAISGGDFTSIQNAINACTPATLNSTWLVRVMPGTYNESINCKKHVHLQGSGKNTTTINGTVNTTDSMVIRDFWIKMGVICSGTSPTILNNMITDTLNTGNGITVSNLGNPWIMENEIYDCQQWGILCQDFNSDSWIIGNIIRNNGIGGIRCENTSPTIQNNKILQNAQFGIQLEGAQGTPAEPTISDNVIAYTGYQQGGVGIQMQNYAEPRIIGNDIYINECGIWINNYAQPSIIGNNINYNYEAGLRIFSAGAGKPVVVRGNHIHSNVNPSAWNSAGVWIQDAWVILTHNNIHNNDRVNNPSLGPDIDYSASIPLPGAFTIISYNVYDVINKSLTAPATGQYNSDSMGNTQTP